MRLFDLCGGATKGAGISAFAKTIMDAGIMPDIIVSVSYSSYIAVALALSKDFPDLREKIVRLSTTVTPEQFMEVNPVNKNGGFTIKALWRVTKHILTFGLLKPEISAGVQNLDALIEELVPEDLFAVYQDGDYAPVYISALDYKTRKPVFFNVKDKSVTYKKFKAIMNASGTMPFYTQGSRVNGRLHFDTGVTDQNAGYKFLKEYPYIALKVKEVFSLYARPEGFEIDDAEEPETGFDVFNWMMLCITIERSLNDEENIMRYCIDYNIKWSAGYLDWIMKSFYDTNPARLEQLKNSSIQRAKEFVKDYGKVK